MLDKIDSDHHDLIRHVCKVNKIPNVILSSATLPSRTHLVDLETSFIDKFGELSQIFTVTNNDTLSNICLIDDVGKVVIPHTYFKSFDSLQKSF